ncbi:MAG: glycosyltransferase family 1 protein [Anaerolineae bacterium]|nr:glycosyltransferase family 1 protein [Anaerolineae bacterium]
MKITILAIGTRGDVQPLVALGQGLCAAGHHVTLAAPENYASLVHNTPIDFVKLPVDPQALLKTELGMGLIDTGYNVAILTRKMIRALEPIGERSLSVMWDACQGADVIVYSILALPAHFFAERLGIPAFLVCLQPLYRTRDFPSIFVPFGARLTGRANWMTHLLVEQVFWQSTRPTVSQWLQNLGPFKAPYLGPFRQMHLQQHPILCGFSPAVVPKPRDWGNSVTVTGYWFLNQAHEWQPPQKLVDFLGAGPPPICVGFGSMNAFSLEERISVALDAIARCGQRAILLTGWSGVSNSALPDDVFAIDQVPHDWLFPQVKAVIHHGGAGTTAAVLRSGVPSIVAPFFFDQFFWGRRVAALNVGPTPIPWKSLSVDALSGAIRQTTDNLTLRYRAIALGQRIRAEDGVGHAVQAIERHVSAAPHWQHRPVPFGNLYL